MKNKMWAYMLKLGANMWGDEGSTHKYSIFRETLITDDKIWRETVDFLPSQGINTVLIDVGDGMQYESHPEISTIGAWSKDKLRKELDHIRSLGMTPIPKLNFSAAHDAWLKQYSRMLSTPIYYQVCEDIIKEVAEVFDYPEYFHLGMDEEDAYYQRKLSYVCIRQHDLWWHDAYFFFDVCEKVGARPWVWAGCCWYDPETYFKKMPKSVLQSNWKYTKIEREPDGTYDNIQVQTYLNLEEKGYDQVPTSSTCRVWYNSLETMQISKEHISSEHLVGHLTAPWVFTTPQMKYALLHDALQFGSAKREVYPED